MGRPTTYSKKIATEICANIALGNSLRSVLKKNGMPAMSTVFKWLSEHQEFSEQYAHACEERSEAMAEDILDIADDGTNDWMEVERKDGSTYEMFNKEAAQRSKLRIETRKWLMSKMKPKKYGEKLDLTSDGKRIRTEPVVVSSIKPRLQKPSDDEKKNSAT